MQELDIEAARYRLFPNSALPSGWNMSVKQWLRELSSLVGTARSEHAWHS
jgi:hypothetical protein